MKNKFFAWNGIATSKIFIKKKFKKISFADSYSANKKRTNK